MRRERTFIARSERVSGANAGDELRVLWISSTFDLTRLAAHDASNDRPKQVIR